MNLYGRPLHRLTAGSKDPCRVNEILEDKVPSVIAECLAALAHY